MIDKQQLIELMKSLTAEEAEEIRIVLAPTSESRTINSDWRLASVVAKQLGYKRTERFVKHIQRIDPALLSRSSEERSRAGQWYIFYPGLTAVTKTIDISKEIDSLEERLEKLYISLGETENNYDF